MSRSLPIEHAETFHRELDGVEFAIRVIQADGALWGHWTCLVCGRRGQSGQRAMQVKSAARSAREHLGAHVCRGRPTGRT